MPAKTGASHGLAAFATLLIGTVFSKFVWDLLPPLGELSLLTMRLLNRYLGVRLPTNERFTGAVVIVLALSFLWGIVYHVGRHGAEG